MQVDRAREAHDARPTKRARTETPHRLSERDVGLLEYIHSDWRPLHAILKQRYTDFLVHEIDLSGHVTRITSLDPPADLFTTAEPEAPPSHWEDLAPYFDSMDALQALARDAHAAPVHSRPLPDKADRTRVHQLLRELAGDTLVSEAATMDDGTPAIRVARRTAQGRSQRDDPRSEAVAAPPYIHFTLQKTNRDSQEALQWLSRFLKLDSRGRASGANLLSVAGTKDKRAVTVQRVALQRGRRTALDVWNMVNHIGQPVSSARGETRRRTRELALTTRAERGLRIAHLAYASAPLQLGDLQGNQFTITLRDVRWADGTDDGDTTLCDTLTKQVSQIERDGFLNYFGMQRFGTGHVSTHAVGLAVLQGDYGEAVRLVLQPPADEAPADADDGAPPAVVAVRAAHAAVAAGQYREAYRLYPKTCVAERAVLEKMSAPHWSPNDALGAFQNIPRSLRLMYVHAYQSYLWNRLVSERVRRHGAQAPVVGDMVECDGTYRVLTADDVAHASIEQVVMPMPGAEVHLPEGWLSDLYTAMLQADGLTPLSLASSRQPEYRLKGAFRRIIQKPSEFKCSFLRYDEPDAPLCATDEDILLHADALPSGSATAPYLAVQLVFQLPPSSYATVLLRELLRTDTSAHAHKALTKQAQSERPV
ncbi:tRNA pseudouridine(13) synthase [Malassezia nana]|uniref:tRNA pseudouridine(13) synthase n=1 Tax=Malassezia nana TaxID=180528 RepID=A0AAF0EID6_9BASI|nr:tRNA pseudouridine(13) synthase [Malassezia nana]